MFAVLVLLGKKIIGRFFKKVTLCNFKRTKEKKKIEGEGRGGNDQMTQKDELSIHVKIWSLLFMKL